MLDGLQPIPSAYIIRKKRESNLPTPKPVDRINYLVPGLKCACGSQSFRLFTLNFDFGEKKASTQFYRCSKCQRAPLTAAGQNLINQLTESGTLAWLGIKDWNDGNGVCLAEELTGGGIIQAINDLINKGK